MRRRPPGTGRRPHLSGIVEGPGRSGPLSRTEAHLIRSARDIGRRLRSRRLAVWLIALTSGYAALASVPALGLSLSGPVFLVLATLLTASTALCAQERSAAALRERRQAGTIDPGRLASMRERLDVRIDAAAVGAVGPDELLGQVAEVLRSRRFRVRTGQVVVSAEQHPLGRFGSPLFHWALVLLFVSVALGQATRFEGAVDVAIGTSVVDAAGSYRPGAVRGPLFGDRFTGVAISVDRIDQALVVDGVERGAAPWVRLTRGGEKLAEGWVYPNSPLVWRRLTLHAAGDTGPALVGRVLDTSGSSTPISLAFQRSGDTSVGVVPQTVQIDDEQTGTTLDVLISPSPGQRIAVEVLSPPELASKEPVVIAPGERAPLAGGTTLELESLTGYITITVVNDWSVPFVYAGFALALIGMSLSVFWPPRSVIAATDPDTGSVVLRVHTSRSDPFFANRLEELVRDSLHPSTAQPDDPSSRRPHAS